MKMPQLHYNYNYMKNCNQLHQLQLQITIDPTLVSAACLHELNKSSRAKEAIATTKSVFKVVLLK